MRVATVCVVTAGFFLASDAAAGRPSYWKKTPAEKTMDNVYKAYGRSGARQRRPWDDMNRQRGRRGGRLVVRRTIRDGGNGCRETVASS